MVYNVAHGGHTLQNLIDNHLRDEVLDNDFDAILFEHTLMNDTARMTDSSNTIAASVSALNYILSNIVLDKDVIFTSCHPYGIDPQDGTPNYYTAYPGMELMKNALKAVCYQNKKPYIDIFDVFKKTAESLGYTLDSGKAGELWTWDGQHQNEPGMQKFWDIIKSSIFNIPIKLN